MSKLSKYLERQCNRVDAVLAMRRSPGRVVGGTAGPEVIRLHVQGGPWIRYAQIVACWDDLAQVLGVVDLDVTRGGSACTAVLTFSTPARFSPWPRARLEVGNE